MMNQTFNKAFFLDRDGTINVDYGYIGKPEDLVLLPGAAMAIKAMNQAGFLVIVVSNQSGVARGYYNMAAVKRVNCQLNELLKEFGAHIDDFYCCPHLKTGIVPEYAMDCECRKPETGLFELAIKEHVLEPALCYACGDKVRDVELLPQIGIPANHLGVLSDNDKFSRYESLEAFTDTVLNSLVPSDKR